MTLLSDVAGAIDTGSATFTAGSNLFAGRMPETPDRCITVFEVDGPGQVEGFGTGQVLDQPRVSVLCRAARDDYGTATGDAKMVHALLDKWSATWGSTTVLRSRPLHTPMGVGVDEQERPLVAVRFQLVVSR